MYMFRIVWLWHLFFSTKIFVIFVLFNCTILALNKAKNYTELLILPI